jgi:flagellar biosynthesis/type III secretory pathway chaperone
MSVSVESISEELKQLAQDLAQLKSLLELEFSAIKDQNIDEFEILHDKKDVIIYRISQVNLKAAIGFLEKNSAQDSITDVWSEIETLRNECQKLQKQNEVLINKKITIISSTLDALKYPDQKDRSRFYGPKGTLVDNP